MSDLISTYCLDAYASQLWDYEDKRIEKYYRMWHGEEQLEKFGSYLI